VHTLLLVLTVVLTVVHPRSRGGLDSNLSYLFEAHPLILAELVPALLGLYADVEHTDRANQFYVKFQMRQYIGDLLAHCWALPAHREAWKRFAAAEGGRGPYLRFANMLINDAIYLLDESLKKLKVGWRGFHAGGAGAGCTTACMVVARLTTSPIWEQVVPCLLHPATAWNTQPPLWCWCQTIVCPPVSHAHPPPPQEMRELEQQMADTAAFAALPPQEQQERQQALQQTGDHLRSLLYLAGGTITTLATSTQEVAAPFLLPEMVERLAAMLNYFLLYLTGPERKNLKVCCVQAWQGRCTGLLPSGAPALRLCSHALVSRSQPIADGRLQRVQLTPAPPPPPPPLAAAGQGPGQVQLQAQGAAVPDLQRVPQHGARRPLRHLAARHCSGQAQLPRGDVLRGRARGTPVRAHGGRWVGGWYMQCV
jgi:hypothetical protein